MKNMMHRNIIIYGYVAMHHIFLNNEVINLIKLLSY